MPGLHGRESVKQEGYGWLSSQGANADEYAGAGEGSLLPVGMGLLEIEGPHGQELALRWQRLEVKQHLKVKQLFTVWAGLSWTSISLV